MPRILVADDNSNIQKMVGLALKDQGIDVVAVGNGEAAVRKISDLRPDLVLADVFMPVRNGYEVCQYVKQDSSLSHIPVILLVGAFDPLDEQEAQRVGADGVLKKPFVPPDPLISMVKSALARAGVSHGAAAEKAPPASVAGVAPPPPVAVAPSGFGGTTAMELSPELADQSFVEEVPMRPTALQFGSGEQRAAFGSLLETPAAGEEQDPGFIPPVHPDLASERDWTAGEEEEVVEEEEETQTSSWRRDAMEETFPDNTVSRAEQDWRNNELAGGITAETSRRGWTPTHEKTGFVEAAENQPAATNAPSTGDAWSAAIKAGAEEKAAIAVAESRIEEVAVPNAAPSQAEERAEEPAPTETASANESSGWMSVPPSPWDAEVHKASQLASTWDAPVVAIPEFHHEAEGVKAETFVENSLNSGSLDATAILPTDTVEAIREEASQVAEEIVAAPHATEEQRATAVTPKPTTTAEADMEAMVAKVLSKLSPEVLQAVTREILKPVIESIVRDELNTKK